MTSNSQNLIKHVSRPGQARDPCWISVTNTYRGFMESRRLIINHSSCLLFSVSVISVCYMVSTGVESGTDQNLNPNLAVTT